MDSAIQETVVPASTLAVALIISSQVPVLLLDGDLEVVAASASFYRTFNLTRADHGRVRFADLGNGEWDVPQLLLLLQGTAADRPEIEAYEMDLIRPGQPTCRLVLSAHKLDYEGALGASRIVLSVTDVTAIRLADKQKDDLLHERQVLMQELQHRVANSLQIIASVLLQSARKVNSEETRNHLNDAHHRVMSIATLQKQLATTQEGEVALRYYFTDLCKSISASMIADSSHLSLTAKIDGSRVDSRVSVSLGLIVTELVINALKHAFPGTRPHGQISVNFRTEGAGWVLDVDDNGIGFPSEAVIKPGLGTGIVEALAGQLDANVTRSPLHPGTRITITQP